MILKEHEAAVETADLCRKLLLASFYNEKGRLEVCQAPDRVRSENTFSAEAMLDNRIFRQRHPQPRDGSLPIETEANNPQQSWGFGGEPPEAVMKDSGTRDGTL